MNSASKKARELLKAAKQAKEVQGDSKIEGIINEESEFNNNVENDNLEHKDHPQLIEHVEHSENVDHIEQTSNIHNEVVIPTSKSHEVESKGGLKNKLAMFENKKPPQEKIIEKPVQQGSILNRINMLTANKQPTVNTTTTLPKPIVFNKFQTEKKVELLMHHNIIANKHEDKIVNKQEEKTSNNHEGKISNKPEGKISNQPTDTKEDIKTKIEVHHVEIHQEQHEEHHNYQAEVPKTSKLTDKEKLFKRLSSARVKQPVQQNTNLETKGSCRIMGMAHLLQNKIIPNKPPIKEVSEEITNTQKMFKLLQDDDDVQRVDDKNVNFYEKKTEINTQVQHDDHLQENNLNHEKENQIEKNNLNEKKEENEHFHHIENKHKKSEIETEATTSVTDILLNKPLIKQKNKKFAKTVFILEN